MADKGRLYKRGDCWYVSIHLDGVQHRRSAGTSKAEAKRMLAELRRADAASRPYAALDDVLKAYLHTLRLRAKPGTVSQVEVHAELLRRHFGERADAAALSPADLDAFVAERLQHVKPASANGSLRVLRSALHHAVEHGALDRLPLRVKLLRTPKRLPRILGPGQVRALVDAARPPFDAVLMVAAHAGLRHREILHLWVRDADFSRMALHVSAKPGWSPKSHAEREVPMSERLAKVLDRHVARLERRGGTDWLFQSHPGKQYTSVVPQVREAFKAAGLYDPDAKPGLHMLRRSWASAMLGNGVDVETVRELGGWADLATVQRYLSSTDDRKRSAVEGLGF